MADQDKISSHERNIDQDSESEGKMDVLHSLQIFNGVGERLSYYSNITLPDVSENIRNCTQALRKIQFDCLKMEADFYKDVHALECKYGKIYEPYYEKRADILSGKYIVTDEDCNFALEEEIICDVQDTLELSPDSGNGIPGFWLTALKNADMLSEMIWVHDEPILEKLIDVVVKLSESDPMGFILEFYFKPNVYFSNSVLTKQYEMQCAVSEMQPFNFEGPEIIKCKGCTIEWKEGQNITLNCNSFFNFFDPPSAPISNFEDSVNADLLSMDFELGHFIRERFVPRAVLFYTDEISGVEEVEECFTEEEDDSDKE